MGDNDNSPSSPHESPLSLSPHNGKQQRPWLPLTMITTSFHHHTTYDNPFHHKPPSHHLTTYNNFSQQRPWLPLTMIMTSFHHHTTYNNPFPSPHDLRQFLSITLQLTHPLSQSPLTTRFHISATKNKFRRGTHSRNSRMTTCLA